MTVETDHHSAVPNVGNDSESTIRMIAAKTKMRPTIVTKSAGRTRPVWRLRTNRFVPNPRRG